MGYWPGYTLAGKRDIHKLDPFQQRELENQRCSQVGNAFHTGVTSWLVAQGLYHAELLERPLAPSVLQCTFFKYAAKRKQYLLDQQRLDREVPAMQRFSAVAQPPSEQGSDELMHSLMIELYRRADHRGSDIRLDVQLPFRYNSWPRVSVDQRRWKHAVAVKFNNERHINELELQMVHNAMRWRLRHFKALGTRVCIFVDSQVTVAVAAKGR